MILVTGAAGKTGRAVIEALVARGAAVRALVHREASRAVVRGLGARSVVVGDLGNREHVRAAVDGVERIYHIGPNMHPDELQLGLHVVEAAEASDCQHLVLHSVLHPQTEAMPHHWCKLRLEERLFEAKLPCTLLQPAAYQQNLLAHWTQIVEDGVLALPYAPSTRISLVDLRDVAEVAAQVLTEPGHAGATYELCGTQALSQHEVAEVLSRVLERPVRAEGLSRSVWAQRARANGLGAQQVDTLRRMFEYYERFDFCGNPKVLTWLLGRSPTDLEAFVARAQGTSSDHIVVSPDSNPSPNSPPSLVKR